MGSGSGRRYGRHALFIAIYAFACVLEYFSDRLKKFAAEHLEGGGNPKDPKDPD